MPEPQLATIVKDWVTAAGIVIGGTWALWKWGFSEFLRRLREIPSLDGRMTAVPVPLSPKEVLVTFEALWRNRGQLPVPLDPARTGFKVYELDRAFAIGPLVPQLGATPANHTALPFVGLSGFLLEPATESVLQAHFVLRRGVPYLVRSELVAPGGNASWQRDLLWSIEATASSDEATTASWLRRLVERSRTR